MGPPPPSPSRSSNISLPPPPPPGMSSPPSPRGSSGPPPPPPMESSFSPPPPMQSSSSPPMVLRKNSANFNSPPPPPKMEELSLKSDSLLDSLSGFRLARNEVQSHSINDMDMLSDDNKRQSNSSSSHSRDQVQLQPQLQQQSQKQQIQREREEEPQKMEERKKKEEVVVSTPSPTNLKELIMKQKFGGNWELKDLPSKLTEAKLKAAIPSTIKATKEVLDFFATAIMCTYFALAFASFSDSWSLVVTKAKKWISKEQQKLSLTGVNWDEVSKKVLSENGLL